ncbi:MAG: L,D-transpeptidase [Desulfomonile tiedjei]|uniref:L,D-transpeptidase n=1 Tax=Desulfomonile tiedjei TaxID=2358 RepID=A0A9D6Z3H6_9BACT|nr:L,D-transpeptidase [Desulfomonile tiedjei]
MRWPIRLAVGLSCLYVLASGVQARDSYVNEMLLSLAHPSDAQDEDEKYDTDIEKILSDSFMRIETRRGAAEVRVNTKDRAASSEGSRNSGELLLPGSSFSEMVGRGRDRTVPFTQMSATSRSAAEILDAGPSFENSGGMVGDPVHLYSTFEILVDRKEYTLRLFAGKGDGEKTLLFACKTGLGSAEYPTPRGTYYVCRIFDDKPMWIPPPSDWAIGESPSNTVYGGHMMPLFKKIPAAGYGKSVEVLDENDILASEMRMVDSGGYRVHGTNSPWSIGQGQSHGCVRLLNSSVKQLADTLKMYVGTTTRGKTANGIFIALARPVKLILN